jgi:hypothetical protein
VLVAVAAVAAAARTDAATVTVLGPITSTTTWTSNNVYLLTNVVYVINNSILTIEPGTLIRGKPDVPGSFSPGTLVISRGSKIMANGTPEQPIIFTDENDDNVPGSTAGAFYGNYSQCYSNAAKWGGLILLGKTYIATSDTAPDSSVENQIEGLLDSVNGKYGGGDDDDSSGELSYVQLRYGGFLLSANNEINGLTMGGVGRGTKVHHIEVFNQLDDGVEWFGGTVNTKYLFVWGSGDDSFDTDEGYRGKGQFWCAIQSDQGGAKMESGLSNRGFEFDGGYTDNDLNHTQPFSLSRTYNVTLIGLGQNFSGGIMTNTANKFFNSALVVRDNAGPQIYNAAIMDFAGYFGIVEISPYTFGGTNYSCSIRYTNTADAAGWATFAKPGPPTAASLYGGVQDDTDNQASIKDCVFWQFGTPRAATNSTDVTNIQVKKGADAPTGGVGFMTVTGIHSNWAASTMPILHLERYAVNSKNGVFNPKLIDPRPRPGSELLTVTRTAPDDGFFTPVGYKGAFGPDENWAVGWTCVDSLGLLVRPQRPHITYNPNSNRVRVRFQSPAGITNIVQRTTDLTDSNSWNDLETIVPVDGKETNAVDDVIYPEQYYRVKQQL